MKALYILIFIVSCGLLTAQYDNLIVGNHTGISLGNDDRGDGLSYGVDIQKHLTRGIYAQLNYASGQLQDGRAYNSESPGLVVFQSDVMVQYRSIGLGLRKEMKVSTHSRIGLSLGANYVHQSRVEWDVTVDGFNNVDLRASQERYGLRNDYGYILSGEYIHKLNTVVRLGVYAGYQSQPELINAGLRVMAALGRSDEEQSDEGNLSKNILEFRVGSLGGDGVSPVPNYSLEYGRFLWRRIALYGKVSIGKGFSDRDPSRFLQDLSEADLLEFERLFLTEDHEGNNTAFHPIQHSIYGIGLRWAFNTAGKSTLSVSGGMALYRAYVVRLSRSGSLLESYRESYRRFNEVLPELGLYYDYNVSDYFYLGGKLDFTFSRFNIGVGLHGGLRF
jgi:hypothetical protein